MSFFKRLFGLESNEERITREDQSVTKAIQAALADPAIREVIQETGLAEKHIRDLHGRIHSSCGLELAARTIRNPELVHWFYNNGGKELHQDRKQYLQLLYYAKQGHL